MTSAAFIPPTLEDVPILLDVFEIVRMDPREEPKLDAIARHLDHLRKLALARLASAQPCRYRALNMRRWTGKLGLAENSVRGYVGHTPVREVNYVCAWCRADVGTFGFRRGARITAPFYKRLDRHTAECSLTYLQTFRTF